MKVDKFNFFVIHLYIYFVAGPGSRQISVPRPLNPGMELRKRPLTPNLNSSLSAAPKQQVGAVYITLRQKKIYSRSLFFMCYRTIPEYSFQIG